MSRIEMVRGRIHQYLRHRYTRQVRVDVATNDDWGDPVTSVDVPPAPAPMTDQLCYFMDAGSYLQGGAGLMQVNVPTILVEYTDPLKVGDQVLSVVDPATGFVLVHRTADVELIGDIVTSGPMLYRVVSLRYAEVV